MGWSSQKKKSTFFVAFVFLLDSAVGSAFAYKLQGSRFDTRFHQQNVWVVQLKKSELYGKLVGAEISCATRTVQEISLVKRNRKEDRLPRLTPDTDTKPLRLLSNLLIYFVLRMFL